MLQSSRQPRIPYPVACPLVARRECRSLEIAGGLPPATRAHHTCRIHLPSSVFPNTTLRQAEVLSEFSNYELCPLPTLGWGVCGRRMVQQLRGIFVPHFPQRWQGASLDDVMLLYDQKVYWVFGRQSFSVGVWKAKLSAGCLWVLRRTG